MIADGMEKLLELNDNMTEEQAGEVWNCYPFHMSLDEMLSEVCAWALEIGG